MFRLEDDQEAELEFNEAFQMLEFAELRTEANTQILMQNPDCAFPISLGLVQLKQAGFLTEDTQALLLQNLENIEAIVRGCHCLASEGLYTEDNFILLASNSDNIESMIGDIILLEKANNLSAEIRTLLKREKEFSHNLLRRFAILSNVQILKQLDLDLVAKHPEDDDDSIAIAIIKLRDEKILTEKNLRAFMEHPALRKIIFKVIGTSPLTQSSLAAILQMEVKPIPKENKAQGLFPAAKKNEPKEDKDIALVSKKLSSI